MSNALFNVPYGALNSSLMCDTNVITILTSVRLVFNNVAKSSKKVVIERICSTIHHQIK